ncbi:MAG: hypothetical protein LBR29_06570, partial [Methylobacteriaceae bacterium]|nr:hypothetical protein [Methylobacteriaceae bacterium]
MENENLIIKVLIFSSSNVIASSLAAFYNNFDGFEATYHSSAANLVERINRDKPNILILREETVSDYTCQMINSIKKVTPNLKIAVMGKLVNDAMLMKLIGHGVEGYF